MNNDNEAPFPFNFSAMDGSGTTTNFDSSGMDNVQQQQMPQVGADGNNNLLLQSLLQGQQVPVPQDQQQQQAQATDSSSNSANAADTESTCWQSCRFCQQRFYTSGARLLEHEISCPMHLQVQQYLQQQQFNQAAQLQQQGQPQGGQQQQQAQNDLQAQLQMQQNQLQQQFANVQQNQFVDTMFGAQGLGQFGAPSSNAGFNANDLQANLLQGNVMEQQFQQQFAQQQAASVNNNDADQFESAIDRLPAFQQSEQGQAEQPARNYPEPKPLLCSPVGSPTDYFPLSLPEDEEWLTPLHCFVRKYCVEVFVATPEDVAAPCMGKRNPVSVSQVGIRCPYCSPERMENSDQVDIARARENGVVYPSLISRIYNSSINLLQRHLRSCAFVPPEILARYEELKSSNARSGASKKYWADSATRLGLLDTPDGIRLNKEVHNAFREGQANPTKAAASAGAEQSQAPPLVLPSDKRNTTAFTFHLMSQMQPCVFTEADRLGRRRGLDVGFAGLACRHCFGVYGSGRFFPSSVKTMADASKTLDVIYRHVMKCKKCPSDIKGGLRNLRDFHDSERSKMPFGNQRAFFVKIWGRLHESSQELAVSGPPPALPAPEMPALPPAPMPAEQAQAVAAHGGKQPSGDGLQGLYALVKRESDVHEQSDDQMNKLATEAA